MVAELPGPPPTIDEEWSEEWRKWLGKINEALTLEDWREVGSSGNAAFENSFLNFSAASSATTAAYRKDYTGLITLKGFITAGTVPTSDIWSLPVGYRPSADQHRMVMATDGTTRGPVFIVIRSDGDVEFADDLTLTWVTTNNTSWLSLDGVSFFEDADNG